MTGMTLAALREHHGVREWGYRAPLAVRLLRHMTEDGECWRWTGALSNKGYGHFSDRKIRGHAAHRTTYEFFVASVPAGLQLDHLCRNRACVRPAHLEPVSNRTNALRGVGPTALNAAKTHCPRDHEYTDANTYRYEGERHCRACWAGARARRAAARAAA